MKDFQPLLHTTDGIEQSVYSLYVTFYDNLFILRDCLCDSSYFGLMLRHTHKHITLLFFSLHIRNLHVNYSVVLDSGKDL